MSFRMLPKVENEEQCERLDRESPVFEKAAGAILKFHGLSSDIARFQQGSAFVYGTEDEVLKLFAPFYTDLYVTELSALEYLQNFAEIPAAKPLFTGQYQGWPYLIMNRIPGVLGTDLWPNLDQRGRESVVERAAKILKILHELDAPGTGVPEPNWERFLQTQIDQCADHQRKFKLDQNWMSQIPDFLSQVELNFREECFLHTELGLGHLLVDPGSLEINGVIDFEPAMIGDPEYDLSSVGIFLTCGDGHLFRLFLRHYRPELLEDPKLPYRVMAYTILHRYSNLNWYIEMLPKAETLEELAVLWWPTEAALRAQSL